MKRLILTILTAATAASANPFELYGFTPRALGLGGAMTSVGDDLGASFYNPAGLIGHRKVEFGVGFADTLSSMSIDRGSSASPISSEKVPPAPRFELGLIFPLGGKLFQDRVVLGIGGGHPVGSLIEVQTIDQSHPQFYMYQQKPQRFALNFAVGVKIFDGLSIGGGAQVTAEQIGKVSFSLDLASRTFTSRDITVDLNTILEPMAGILIEPTQHIHIGFSWRKESQLYYTQPTAIDLGDLGSINLDVQGLAQYWPHVFSGAISINFTDALLVAVQADYYLWSHAPNDQVQVTVTPSGAVLTTLGLGSILTVPSNDARMGFVNILVPHLAVEWKAASWLTLRTGGYVRPPVTPDQGGVTNYLDNFTECIGAGLTLKFTDPLQVFTDPVAFDLGGQVLIANSRTSTKQSADPTGSYTYGGQLFSFAAMLRYLY
jgi:long-subunit fatty acid transport protein